MDRKSVKSRRNLLNYTLRGLPELECFPDAGARQKAIEEIGAEAGNPRTGSFWLGIVLVAGAALLSRFLAKWLLSLVLWSRIVEEILETAVMFGGFLLVLGWLHRSGTARDLRRKLLVLRVPICMHCGYLLRGLPQSAGRCPECGTPFSPAVCDLLAPESKRPAAQEPL